MRIMKPANWGLIGPIVMFLLCGSCGRGEERSKSEAVPEKICAKFQGLFQKYYPKATFNNSQVNGIHFEYEVGRFEFPENASGGLHESPIQRGPKKGGIMCRIYCNTGEYHGQIFILPHHPSVRDKRYFKQLLAAPYSAKRNAHLWVALDYPADASEEFVKEFRALLESFEKDAD